MIWFYISVLVSACQAFSAPNIKILVLCKLKARRGSKGKDSILMFHYLNVTTKPKCVKQMPLFYTCVKRFTLLGIVLHFAIVNKGECEYMRGPNHIWVHYARAWLPYALPCIMPYAMPIGLVHKYIEVDQAPYDIEPACTWRYIVRPYRALLAPCTTLSCQ